MAKVAKVKKLSQELYLKYFMFIIILCHCQIVNYGAKILKLIILNTWNNLPRYIM